MIRLREGVVVTNLAPSITWEVITDGRCGSGRWDELERVDKRQSDLGTSLKGNCSEGVPRENSEV